MRALLRALARLFAALGVLLLLLLAVISGALWLTLPRGNLQARIPGLSAPVDVTFDSDGIPRIHAANEEDAAAALGFVHARDRLFQMELMRRNASGRLSELAGPMTLPLDRMMRTLGLSQSAEADYAVLTPETRAVLDAYARGVNAYIGLRGRFSSPEFLVLGQPEPWKPADSLLWAKTMGIWLSANWRTELSRLSLADRVPQRLIDELWPPEPGGHPEAALTPPRAYAEAAERVKRVLPVFPGPFTMPGSASNEWAVDGRHSASGAPLLAGDPHLQFGYPAIWYLARIQTNGLTLNGATAPGIPGLVLGHNGRIAWTFTTTGADVQDVFIETPAGDGMYQTPEGPAPFVVREERIKVRGQPDEVLRVRATRHGPVISDLMGGQSGAILAVSMANLMLGDTAAQGLFALNHAATVAEAGNAAAAITSPVQNLLVADSENIGLFVTGRVPIRRAGDGSVPAPGDGSHDWIGWANGEQLPHIVNPPSGRLVNANERIAPPDFPVFMGRDSFGDWRARRIREMLDRAPKHTVADFMRMQTDAQSTFARQILPMLAAVSGLDGAAAKAQALLRGWDGTMAIDLPQPLIFNAWMEFFYQGVLQKAGIPLNDGGPAPDFVAFVLSPAGSHWCNGDCAPLLRAAMNTAMQTLTKQYGGEPSSWRWGDAHRAVFAHPVLRMLPGLGALTTVSVEAPGDDSTVNRGGLGRDFRSVHGAAYRGVYDLADLEHSRFVITPGQSGNPLSRYSANFAARWAEGCTVVIGERPDRVTATIRLTP